MRIIGVLIVGMFFCALQCAGQTTDPKFGKIKVRKYKEQQFYVEVETVPKYVDGADALLDDIQKGIVYPEEAISQNLSGTVMVKVIIDKFGNVTSTSIDSSPNTLFNQAAMAAAKSLNKFEPHLLEGRTVPCQFVLPVRFILPL